MMNGRRVAITGRGVVSALGETPEELFDNLAAGKSAVRRQEQWDGILAAPVDLDEKRIKSIPRSARRSMGRVSILSALAGDAAFRDSGLTADDMASLRTGCVIGSTMGSSEAMEESFRTLFLGNGMSDISPMAFFRCASHTAAFNTAAHLGIAGMVYAPAAACASGLQAVGLGATLIAAGQQDIVLAGGADEVGRVVSGCFELMNAYAPSDVFSPEQSARPFDRDRRGLVCGEGAGLLMLEEYEHAKKRGAVIHGEILSYATCSCPDSFSQSDANSILRCLRELYRGTDFRPEDTGYIGAHATSTPQGDRAEAAALREFFGGSVPVSSLKGHLGHTLAASGSLELMATLEMMRRNVILPTLNLENPDPECEGIDLVREIREKEFSRFLKNSFAFGGINAALICGKV